MTLKPCRVCGAQPKIEGVQVAHQDAVRYGCPCGRHGAARKTGAAAEEAWNDLQCWTGEKKK